jgi:hypothetical protein
MNYRLSFLLLILFLCSLAACKPSDNYIVPASTRQPPALNVINATADTLDYFINGTRQNNYSDIYVNGATNYLYALFGTGSYSFKKAGSQVTLFKQQYTLDTTTFYSIFVCGETSDKTFMVTPADNIPQAVGIDTVANTAAVRFVNASPNAGSLNVVFTNTSVSLTSCPFKYVSSFFGLKDTVIDVKVYQTGSTQVLKDTSISLFSGQAYTLFSKGTPNALGGKAFGLVLVSSNPVIYTQTP